MRSLSDTIARLKRLPRAAAPRAAASSSRLVPFRRFGSNPGKLAAWIHVPDRVAPGAPLVVVLHGCTQNAGDYDESSGWSRLADEHGFLLLYPEQTRSNNPHLCFNWFSPEDAARGKGEALSIRQMIAAAQAQYGIDGRHVFINGLSAGGAMAAVMLATYPELFAGGAVIGGLPFGTARSVPEAFDRMRGEGGPTGEKLPRLVRGASNHSGPWPRLSVWHGSADRTVVPVNADQVVEQWRPLHGVPPVPSKEEQVGGHQHRVWSDGAGRPVIEEYRVRGMGHGVPLDTQGSGHGEHTAPFMLDAGISSTRLISEFWGIVPKQAALHSGAGDRERTVGASPPASSGIAETIEGALRSAGLMR